MKLLVFSDNHRDKESLIKILDINKKIDRYISLGDSEMREYELTELNVFGVKGNYPFEPNFPKELTLVFEDTKVYITHGHLWSVKMGLSRLLNYALYNNINLVLYGHTHTVSIKEIEEVIFVNPGCLSKSKMGENHSYALIDISEKQIDIVIKKVNGEILKEYHKKR